MTQDILKYYKEIFVPSYEGEKDEDVVDISLLILESQNWTPVKLNYSDVESKLKLGEAIVCNFCKAYWMKRSFPRKGIDAMSQIILGTHDSEDTVAAQIFVLHISKRALEENFFAYLVNRAMTFKIKRKLCEDEKQWVELVQKVHHHPELNKVINQCLKDYGQETLENEETDLQDVPLKITLIESKDKFVRGFAGFGEIFVNTQHFHQKIRDFGGDIDMLQVVAKLDVISLAVHELAHIQIRKIVNDFNLHSPLVAQLTRLQGHTEKFEFGVYTETKLFTIQPDWFGSFVTLNVGQAEKFISSVESQKSLPSGTIKGVIRRRGNFNTDGVDIERDNYLC